VGKALAILALTVGVPVGGAAVVGACTVQTIFPFGTAPLPGSASQMVGAAGGLVTANDGTTLLIPPQALSGDVTITIALDPDTAELPNPRALGAAHLLGPPGQAFTKPVCVTVSFEPALLPPGTTETNVVLYATQEDGGYAPVTTLTADPTHVTGMVSVFSTVVAAYGSAEEADASDANCDANQLDGGEEL
jgi:ZU5 domain